MREFQRGDVAEAYDERRPGCVGGGYLLAYQALQLASGEIVHFKMAPLIHGRQMKAAPANLESASTEL